MMDDKQIEHDVQELMRYEHLVREDFRKAVADAYANAHSTETHKQRVEGATALTPAVCNLFLKSLFRTYTIVLVEEFNKLVPSSFGYVAMLAHENNDNMLVWTRRDAT